MIVRRRWTAAATTAILISAVLSHPGSAAAAPAAPAPDHPDRHRDRSGPGPAPRSGPARPAGRHRRGPGQPAPRTGRPDPRRPGAHRHPARRADRAGRDGGADRAARRGRQPALRRQRPRGPGPHRRRAARSGRRPTDHRRAAAVDTLQVQQAYWWTTGGQTFLQAQVATTATDDPDVEITVSWRTADGATGSFPLYRFEDSGEYQYHYNLPQPVPNRPVQLTATSSLGGVSRGGHADALAERGPAAPAGRLPEGLHRRVPDADRHPGADQAAGPPVPGPGGRDRPAEQDPGVPTQRRRLPGRPGGGRRGGRVGAASATRT